MAVRRRVAVAIGGPMERDIVFASTAAQGGGGERLEVVSVGSVSCTLDALASACAARTVLSDRCEVPESGVFVAVTRLNEGAGYVVRPVRGTDVRLIVALDEGGGSAPAVGVGVPSVVLEPVEGQGAVAHFEVPQWHWVPARALTRVHFREEAAGPDAEEAVESTVVLDLGDEGAAGEWLLGATKRTEAGVEQVSLGIPWRDVLAADTPIVVPEGIPLVAEKSIPPHRPCIVLAPQAKHGLAIACQNGDAFRVAGVRLVLGNEGQIIALAQPGRAVFMARGPFEVLASLNCHLLVAGDASVV